MALPPARPGNAGDAWFSEGSGRLLAQEGVDLPLRLGEAIALDDTEHGDRRTQAEEDDTERPNLPETAFYVF